ncbi:MAG TPA: hypothetical protein DCR65_08400 [Gammaproteobacteria bacterium]|jgi:hypothetical protein|nr:hypothetical protein [Gammaproteobacteria bacterium]
MPLSIEIFDQSEAGTLVILDLPPPAALDFSISPTWLTVRGPLKTRLAVMGRLPSSSELADTALSGISFGGGEEQALRIDYRSNYSVSVTSSEGNPRGSNRLVLRFVPKAPEAVATARVPTVAAPAMDRSAAGALTTEVVVAKTTAPSEGHAIPRPRTEDFATSLPVPDRWRILSSLGPPQKWYDPYNQNPLKADFPIHDEWFFNLTATSDTIIETREVPTPVGLQSTRAAGSNDVFGGYEQAALVQNVALEFVYYEGDTVFRPVDWEFRFTPVFNMNYTEVDEILAVDADPGTGQERQRTDVGVQSLFVDKHLWNVSDNYDFDSIRLGIQPFSSDFRGFLFQDSPFGVRLFGNRMNNHIQYNVAWFRRLDKDVNSGLNDTEAGLRDDDLYIANLYWQDLPSRGFFSELLFAYNRNRETDNVYDDNNFIARPASIGLERPRTYDVYYLGLGGDGHFQRLNLTSQLYWAFGEERDGIFTGSESDIDGLFFAMEPSVDFDWVRLRGSLLYASGDSDPYDDRSQAFDAIFENPIFAGADTSYWIRQAVPLIGGGRVTLSGRNGLLNSMRSSKEQGQSNFTNPGLILAGLGADADLLPQLRLSLNANSLRFADTAVLQAARATTDIEEDIGLDLSASLIWRPFMTQNVVFRVSYASLLPGQGFEDLYGDGVAHSFLTNMVLTW